jgi:hexosaminidase
MNKLSGTSVSMLSKEITSNSNYYKIANDSEYCNFNQIQYKLEKLKVGSFLPLEKVYDFNPIPKNFTNLESAYILGGQANVWTEYISSMFQLEYMVLPRALAMSQVLWCREQKPSFESFKNTLIDYQFPFLYRYKVNYSIAILNPRKIE